MNSAHQSAMLPQTNAAGDENLLLARGALDALEEMIFVKDERTRYILANRATAAFLGTGEADILGMTVQDCLPRDVASECRASDKRVLAEGKSLITRQTIGDRIYEIRKFPVPLPGHGYGVGGVMRDITERTRCEEALRNSESRYRELAETLPQVIFELDLGGYFTFGNRQGVELFGYTIEDLKELNVLQLIVPEERERATSNLRMVLRGEPRPGNQYTVLRKDGSTFSAAIFTLPILREDRPVGFRGMLVDITEHKRNEDRLRYLGTHDHLTGLYNRSYFEEELSRLEAGRHFPVSIIIADVDYLKKVNDREGHLAGDDLLRRTAAVLATFRGEDVVARIGGDEFAVILPSTDAMTAGAVLERIRGSLAEHNSGHPDKPLGLSFGMATGEKGCSLKEVMRRADEGMYRHKRTSP